jgi:hypothetical protein
LRFACGKKYWVREYMVFSEKRGRPEAVMVDHFINVIILIKFLVPGLTVPPKQNTQASAAVIPARTRRFPQISLPLGHDPHRPRFRPFSPHLCPAGGLDVMSTNGQSDADVFASLGQAYVIKVVRLVPESLCYGTSLSLVDAPSFRVLT